ncbi:unnamed protein product [Paramecium pentaurelia]|uniref:Mannose-P-dolichol utilization defect 1 protein homolog n=1 Tax=Paramecium pentaurelia TaxID=43138 RepID=A0A8S1W8R1_9CILI|nr:unnamed protein product [Paramecium pentaurelia]CAD8186375.1 unnamed protein product [Paramecium pentaurelia]
MKYFAVLVILYASLLCTCYSKSTEKNEKSVYFIFSEECFDKLVLQKDFLNIECIKKTLSELISYSIVALSVILKAPQIFKIVQKSKVTGLSFDSIFFELFVYSFSIAYNMHKQNPWKLYAENVAILIQTVIIVALYKIYEKQFTMRQFYIRTAIFIGINLPLFTGLIPNSVFNLAIIINICLIMFARLPQIWSNFRNKDTGQLAFITIFLQFAGAAARCFTILVSSTDGMLILLNVISVTLNFTLVFQMITYWNSKKGKTD